MTLIAVITVEAGAASPVVFWRLWITGSGAVAPSAGGFMGTNVAGQGCGQGQGGAAQGCGQGQGAACWWYAYADGQGLQLFGKDTLLAWTVKLKPSIRAGGSCRCSQG